MANNTNKQRLITYADIEAAGDFPIFKNDRERIKYMTKAYANMSIAKSMEIFYTVEISQETKKNRQINTVNTISLGQTYIGTVKTFTKTSLTFDIPGVKEEIICKENLGSCMDEVNNFLITHNNKLLFQVREKKDNKYIVSVIQAYYNKWMDQINKAIQKDEGIQVHIDSLVNGGYICHTNITTLCELTGRNYTHSVFIPGSHIVLNIERDFEKWVGQDVVIIPQKFVEFRKDIRTGEVENSLVGSRKKVLQILGMNNLSQMYNTYLLTTKNANVKYTPESYEGIVTGVINSSNKTGIFVELIDKHITGLMPVDVSEILDYKPGDSVNVRIKEFEVQEGKDPFIINKKGKVVKSNTRPIFELA